MLSLNLQEALHAAVTATAMTIATVGVAAGVDATMISKYSRDYNYFLQCMLPYKLLYDMQWTLE